VVSGGKYLPPSVGSREDLAGMSMPRFDADGLSVEERDFRNQG
jgi:hypothetical protein